MWIHCEDPIHPHASRARKREHQPPMFSIIDPLLFASLPVISSFREHRGCVSVCGTQRWKRWILSDPSSSLDPRSQHTHTLSALNVEQEASADTTSRTHRIDTITGEVSSQNLCVLHLNCQRSLPKRLFNKAPEVRTRPHRGSRKQSVDPAG